MQYMTIGILGLGGCGLLVKFLVYHIYRKLIREAKQMGTSKHPLVKLMMTKFEATYHLKMSVENVGVFVEKHIMEYRIAGMTLNQWRSFSDVFSVLTILACLSGNLYVILMKYSLENQILVVMGGIITCGSMVLLDVIFANGNQKHQLLMETQDYLENVFRPRLENQVFKKNEMEEYHKEYFEREREDLDEILQSPKPKEVTEALAFSQEEQAVIDEILKEYFA